MNKRIVIGALVIVLGVATFISAFPFGNYEYDRAVITQSQWPIVMGKVESSNLKERAENEIYLVIEFEYSVDSIVYSGEQEWYVGTKQLGLPQQQDYTPGKTVPVYHNPDTPAKAVVNTALVDEIPRSYIFLYIGGSAVFLVGLYLILYWRKPKPAAS